MKSMERVSLRRSARANRRQGVKEAIALAYDPKKDQVPTVVAKGRGRIAQAIVDRAQSHGVTVVSDPVTLEALRFLDVGQEIPPRVYHMVAELLAFVYNLGEKSPKDE